MGSVSFGWLSEYGHFAFDEPFFMNPLVRLERERKMHALVAERFPDEPIYNLEAHLVQIEGRQKPVVLVGGLQPNLILGATVGAEFVFYEGKDPDITPTPLEEMTDVEDLADFDWADTWPISLFLEQIQQLREKLDDSFAIIPPFFWDTTGRATTHGILTTAQKLIGERIFLEIADNPAFVHEFFTWIVDAYVELIHLFAEAASMNITSLHTGDCSACMMGADQYAEFVLPHLNDFVQRVGPVRLHSCGQSDHLLDVFKQVDNLRSLNVGSGTSVAQIREKFGPIRIDLMPETHLLTSGKPEQVDAWVRQSLKDNGNGDLQFQYHLDLNQPEVNCLQINKTLKALGIDTPRVHVH
jgi:uroporphyrinogen-III decarboxylase